MAYIESHQQLAQHPKTKKLARVLGASVPTVVGYLHLLWWWALDYAPDGQLGSFDDDVIADGCMWEGDPAVFVAALKAVRFLDPDGSIHDWFDYAGKLVVKRREDAERKRFQRHPATNGTAPSVGASFISSAASVDVQQTSDGHPADGAGSEAKRSEAYTSEAKRSGGGGGHPPDAPPLAACLSAFETAAGRVLRSGEADSIRDWLDGLLKHPAPRDLDAFRWAVERAAREAKKANCIAFAASIAADAPERAPPPRPLREIYPAAQTADEIYATGPVRPHGT